jgi:MFS family permease
MQLQCLEKETISFIGSAYFLGMLMSLFIIPRLSDIYGRRTIFLATIISQLLCQFDLLILASSFSEAIVAMFILGFSTGSRITACYVYIVELIPKHL